jgi:glucosamine--fructose-6-phosphate aminotransferase (isomerizing)
MCGIVGYVGKRPAQPILLESLKLLEYRGYDSAGIATVEGVQLHIRKRAGRIEGLAALLAQHPAPGSCGVGHTRWATHGAPSDLNAHPHVGGEGVVAVVHNGVIENYLALRERLEEAGYRFVSQTDTEAIAHLLAYYLEQLRSAGSDGASEMDLLVEAVRRATRQLKGTYGLAILSPLCPDLLIGARLGSPLVLGVGKGEHFLASDPAALVRFTDRVVYLNDGEIVVLRREEFVVEHHEKGTIVPSIHALDWTADDADRGPYPHYMLKEIFEQPQAIENAMRGRINEEDATAHFGGLNLTPQQLAQVRRIILTGCGTSWHAGLVGEYLIEEFARIPVEVEYASELRYRNPPVEHGTILFAIAQSGETADTLAALRESKRKGIPTLAIVNVVGSTIAREADGGIYLHAGPEIGVASTKAFTAQLTVLTLLALFLGRMRHLSAPAGARLIRQLRRMPEVVRYTLENVHDPVRELAYKYYTVRNFLYLGRHYNFPIALEGALKLKEISYIHAEGLPAAEMKHGPIALVDEKTPSVIINPRGWVYEKVMANLEEIKARGGPVIAIANEGDEEIARRADDVIYVPAVEDYLQPLVTVIPLQLLAYYIAVLRGCDVDKPRNLAKSVTVE